MVTTLLHPPARILVACDKFKGSLDAAGACAAIADGLARRFPEALIETRPIADGGEGFTASLEIPLCGQWVEVSAHDALGRPVTARYLLASAADGPLAVMEMAEASGMWRIAPDERDVLRASTFGTGEMMRHAIDGSGARRLVIGLGGSATNDGGAGMAAALGVRFLDAHGCELCATPAELAGKLARIDMSGCVPLPPVTVACDVESPLLGPAGATRVFGPQKGADAASMPVLEDFLETLVRVSGGEENAQCPGAGAAGGLGFGLLHFAAARLVPGFDLLASLTGLEQSVAAADLIVTGEGSLDAQSLTGKGPVAIARLARRHGKPVIAFCGRADAAARDSGLFDAVHELAASGLPPDELMARAGDLLESAASILKD
ncbi:MAG: glycerate kinase [Verrucomicrobiaceae bacterium]|nr:MAG: glycerate kinase [Verrucomicrobiaceae bacterium]